MTLGSPRSSETNGSPLRLRLVREHVHRRPGDMAALDMGPQGDVVDDEPTGKVEEQATLPHPGELGLAEKPPVVGPAVHVQGDDVDRLEQLFERGTPFGIAQRQFVAGVVEPHRHAQGFGQHRQLRADVPVTHDAQAPAPDLVAALGRLVPDPLVHLARLVGQAPLEGDYLRDHQFDNAAGIGEGGVEHGHAVGTGGPEVDLVGADTEGAHRQQVRRRLEGGRAHVGIAPDAEHVDVRQVLAQLRFSEGVV